VISVSCAQTIHERGVIGVPRFEDRNVCLSHLCATKVQFDIWILTLKASICEARMYVVFRESELETLSRSYKLLAFNSLCTLHVPTCPLNVSSWWSRSCPSDFISTQRDEKNKKAQWVTLPNFLTYPVSYYDTLKLRETKRVFHI